MVLVLFFALLLLGCTHERDNPYDPHGTNYNPGLYPISSSLPVGLVPCRHAAGCAEISAEACFAFGGQLVASCLASSSSHLLAAVSSSGEAGSSSSMPPVMVLCRLSDGTCPLTLISQEACYMFDGTPVQSCAGSSSSAVPSSSSVALSSSSSVLPSSSSVAPSSSSVPTFACAMTATTGTVGLAITPAPAVTCNGSTVTAGLAWTPANLTPATAGNVSVSVSASSGVCSGRAAQCGSITVSPPTLACAMTATTGTVGLAITPAPAVTCNGSTVTAGLAWTPASLIPSAGGSVPVSVSASSGVCSGRVAQCGSIVSAFTYGSLFYEGQSYKTIKIGTQTWMAENLNYVVEGSKCYDNDPAYCNTYGSLYDWATAMSLPSSCDSASCSSQIQSKHQGICPDGWHIPNNADWDKLYRYVDGTSGTSSPYQSFTAPEYLKATSGWSDNGVNGTDKYGFSALPGGCGWNNGSFHGVSNNGYYWSASEHENERYFGAYGRIMGKYYCNSASFAGDNKSSLWSVRCLQD